MITLSAITELSDLLDSMESSIAAELETTVSVEVNGHELRVDELRMTHGRTSAIYVDDVLCASANDLIKIMGVK